ncbi:MAG: acyl-CoA dehydrogenase family protein [Pontixanthobacter sp.]
MNWPNGLEAALLRSAPVSDRSGGSLTADLAMLKDAGFHTAPLPVVQGGQGWACDPGRLETLFAALRMLGRANLSVGRIFEGHLNALKLIELYGSDAQMRDVSAKVAQGCWLGVWGAEGRNPVTFDAGMLQGSKQFASGIDDIGAAIVPVGSGSKCQLYLAPCDDSIRGDASSWKVSGMRATRSGIYDFSGVAAQPLGPPGDYQREPYFEGGVWRYCAVHLGGAEALRDEAMAAIARRKQQDAPRQRERIATMATLCETMRLWVWEAASRVEYGSGEQTRAAKDGRSAAAYALLARERTELACLEVMTIADRAMGTAGHAEGCPADRVRRDLGLFLRQADIDGKLDRATQAVIDANGKADEM